MHKLWGAVGLAAILAIIILLQFYGLRQLQHVRAEERVRELQRATFLCASEIDFQVADMQTQFEKASGDPQRLRDTWQQLTFPDTVAAVWLIPSDPTDAVQLTRDAQTQAALPARLQGWLAGTGPFRGLPPLLVRASNQTAPAVVVEWQREYFTQTFVPECFARIMAYPDPIRYHLLNAADGESLAGTTALHADSSTHLYPAGRIRSAWLKPKHAPWPNPHFSPANADLHFQNKGALRLETQLVAGSLADMAKRRLRQDLIPALVSLLLVVLTFTAMGTYLHRAQALSQQQAAMMAAFSHELRTPLATIGMAGENLADATVHDPDKVRTYGRLITQESGRLNTMVMQVLHYSRLFGEQRPTETGHADVAAGLAQVERELALLLEGKRCKLRIDCNEPPPVAMEPEALLTVLRNLISNAIKFGPEQSTVAIAVRPARHQQRNGISIQVSDQGDGIPKGERRRVYQQFYRGVRARADQIQGTGLGLSLVAKLVQQAHGRIDHDSQEGRGTTFTLWLPQAAEPQP